MKNKKYHLEWILCFGQMLPGSPVFVMASCIYLFRYILISKHINILRIFIVLIPSLAIKGFMPKFHETYTFNNFWINNFLEWDTSLDLGFLVLTPALTLALGVPIRLFLSYKRWISFNSFFYLTTVIGISFVGLFLAVYYGLSSAGGLTVGFRMALLVSILFLPILTNLQSLMTELFSITKVSIILFLLSLLNGHWIFLAVPFFCFFTVSKKVNLIWRLMAFLCVVCVIVFPFTFTIKLEVAFFYIGYFSRSIVKIIGKLSRQMAKSYIRVMLYSLILMPILILPLAIIGSDFIESLGYFSEFFIYKLKEDRGALWAQTILMIYESNPFIVPAGRDIPLLDYIIKGETSWEAGAHNIFLEMARQNGIFFAILAFTLMIILLRNIIKDLFFSMHKLNWGIACVFIAIFASYGSTGNYLIMDGYGFIFWFAISQLGKLFSIQKVKSSQ